jgi:hypothetical protein
MYFDPNDAFCRNKKQGMLSNGGVLDRPAGPGRAITSAAQHPRIE